MDAAGAVVEIRNQESKRIEVSLAVALAVEAG